MAKISASTSRANERVTWTQASAEFGGYSMKYIHSFLSIPDRFIWLLRKPLASRLAWLRAREVPEDVIREVENAWHTWRKIKENTRRKRVK